MTRLIGCAILFALLLGLFNFHYTGHGVSAQAKNVAAPAFTLKLLDGGTLKSSELIGKVQVLKFVASYWPHCRQEAPAVEKVQREFKDREGQFIGIFVRDTEAAVRRFVKTSDLTFPVALDDGMKIASSYDFVGTPYTVIVSKDGLIADRSSGPQSEQALRQKIEKLLK